MPPPRLHHATVCYPPGKEATARAFYTERLGLPEIERLTEGSGRAGIWLGAGEGHVHLTADPDLGLHSRKHFGLRVSDLDVIVARLRAAGDRIEEATPIPGWRRVYTFDPFGNRIELDEIP